jgi:phenylglyoxylate dehydrogenase epsilon subunit
MEQTDYLIAGASHAALAALHAIRMADRERTVTVIGRDEALPYSPTVLPYVVSGRSDPERVFLREEAYFARHRTDFRRGRRLARLDPARKFAELNDGSVLQFGKLLLATGARPVIPEIRGLDRVPYHVLRTLDDAVRLRGALADARHAVVLGAGLVGLHAAENLRRGGAQVTVIELQSQILPGYFDAEAAALISRAFEHAGVEIRTGARMTEVAAATTGFLVTLDNGESLAGDLLLVSAGVAPVMDYLQDSTIARDRGILVDETMRTSAGDVWAAGDVAQAPSFYDAQPVLNGILPDAVEQGRVAGMAMADDPARQGYRGAVPLNTYSYFGRHAVSVGSNVAPPAAKVVTKADATAERYLKIILDHGRLHGIFAINTPLDAGVLWELVRRRTDLAPVEDQFVAQPRATARLLMSRLWR